MAHRVAPPARDADNTVGNARIAALSDWRRVDADSMSARDSKILLQMPDIRLQALSQHAIKPDRLSYLREESIYDLLGRRASDNPVHNITQRVAHKGGPAARRARLCLAGQYKAS